MKTLKWYERYLPDIIVIICMYISEIFLKKGLEPIYVFIPLVFYIIFFAIWIYKNKKRMSKSFIIGEIIKKLVLFLILWFQVKIVRGKIL